MTGLRGVCLSAIMALVVGISPVAGTVALAQDADQAPISAAGDGPYLTAGQAGAWRVLCVSDALTRLESGVAASGEVVIASVGEVPAFAVPLRPPVTALAADDLPLDPTRCLLVMADTHGEFEIVVAFLKAQGVIDDRLRWTFGDGQMVVTGDMFDRGAHQLEILWLLYKLGSGPIDEKRAI